jgi:hypothetical protein
MVTDEDTIIKNIVNEVITNIVVTTPASQLFTVKKMANTEQQPAIKSNNLRELENALDIMDDDDLEEFAMIAAESAKKPRPVNVPKDDLTEEDFFAQLQMSAASHGDGEQNEEDDDPFNTNDISGLLGTANITITNKITTSDTESRERYIEEINDEAGDPFDTVVVSGLIIEEVKVVVPIATVNDADQLSADDMFDTSTITELLGTEVSAHKSNKERKSSVEKVEAKEFERPQEDEIDPFDCATITAGLIPAVKAVNNFKGTQSIQEPEQEPVDPFDITSVVKDLHMPSHEPGQDPFESFMQIDDTGSLAPHVQIDVHVMTPMMDHNPIQNVGKPSAKEDAATDREIMSILDPLETVRSDAALELLKAPGISQETLSLLHNAQKKIDPNHAYSPGPDPFDTEEIASQLKLPDHSVKEIDLLTEAPLPNFPDQLPTGAILTPAFVNPMMLETPPEDDEADPFDTSVVTF